MADLLREHRHLFMKTAFMSISACTLMYATETTELVWFAACFIGTLAYTQYRASKRAAAAASAEGDDGDAQAARIDDGAGDGSGSRVVPGKTKKQR